MRRFALVLTVVFLWTGLAWGQTLPQSGPLIAATNTVTANPAPASSIAFQVVGTFVGTITFEASADGTTFVSLLVTNATDGSTATTSTTTGIFTAANGGYIIVRARASAWTSGRADVSIVQGYGQAKVASPVYTNAIANAFCVSNATKDSYVGEVAANDIGLYTNGTNCASGTVRLDLTSTRALFAVPAYLPDGTVAAPSLTFASQTTTGFYKPSAGVIVYSSNGANKFTFNGDTMQVGSGGQFGWTASDSQTGVDLLIQRDAANTLAQRNGTTAQLSKHYNTFTDASNYERVGFNWSGNVFTIAPEAAGSGTLRTISYSLALNQAEPIDQTARSSSGGTFVMMGLGAAAAPCTITPTSTGRVFFVIEGDLVNNTTATTVSIKMAENTGSAPANNAAATGTVISRTLVTNAVTSVLTTPFTLTATKTGLALNTAVWFDLQLTTSGANTGQPTNIDCTAHEI